MAESKHKLTPRAFLDLKIPRDPHVSPDGSRVVFEVHEADFEESRYVSRLWMADVADGVARQITFSYEGDHSARWSPDGRSIAFLSSRPDMTEPPPEDETEEDQHKDHLWILPANGGEARRLVNPKEGILHFEWMPDSKAIVYLTDEAKPGPIQAVHDDRRKRKVDAVVEHEDRPRKQLWEVTTEDRKPEVLYTGDKGITDFVLSPDGNRLAFISNTTGDPNDYHLYDLFVLDLPPLESPHPETELPETREEPEPLPPAEPRRLTERPGAKFAPRWSPDGSRIAFLSGLDPNLSYSQECVWLVDAEGGDPANLFAAEPYDAHDLLWPRGSESLYARIADRTCTPLARIGLDGAQLVTPTETPIVCSDYDVGPTGVIAAVLESDTSVPELFIVESDGTRRAVTELNKQFVEQFELPRQVVIRWQTDIGEIEGVLTRPTDDGRRMTDDARTGRETPNARGRPPLIVQVHGGPKGHSANSLRGYHMPAVWASEGYMVLQPNFRGSEGYGNAFAISNRRDLGGGDFRDIMAGMDFLIEQGMADAERIGIMGGSYGGYMTNWAIGHTDRFKAAISMFGIFNLVTDFSNSALSRWDPEYMGAHYWEDPEIYRQCSPSTYLENIRTPVLIVHGESDDNTFISNSKEMYQVLRARGVTCRFVHYPREGHGVREPAHKLDEMHRCLAWMDRYLKGEDAKQPFYRIGDKIRHQAYEFHVTRVEEPELAGWHEENGRLLEVSFSLASDEPVEAGWEFALADARLSMRGGDECAFRGVPAGAGGGRYLVEGENLTVHLSPDEKTGRLSISMAAAYEIPHTGGELEFLLADFPPVAFSIGPKESDDSHPPNGGAASIPSAPSASPPD